ncbi:hypothetical protein QH494_08220 [Sphingomonas sp. AR_OL41]|nr:hypothetical protein [Sphingomonas sp. AR_OL41]
MEEAELERLTEMGFSLIEFVKDDLFWVIRRSQGDISLTISWSWTQRSFQTVISVDDMELSRICSEGLEEILVKEDGLLARFNLGGFVTTVKISNKIAVNATWSTLEV